MKPAIRNTDTEISKESPGIEAKLHCYDNTYQKLLGIDQWLSLKAEIRNRFSVKPANNTSIHYQGTMHIVRFSPMGWLFAQLCRLIGTPLAPYQGNNIPMKIELFPDHVLNGVVWQRTYQFEDDKNITVKSTKSVNKYGSLEEHIGCGFSMCLKTFEKDGNLYFVSEDYLFRIWKIVLSLPAIITPGVTTVKHEQLQGNKFRFTLSVVHSFLGETIFQEGIFWAVH